MLPLHFGTGQFQKKRGGLHRDIGIFYMENPISLIQGEFHDLP